MQRLQQLAWTYLYLALSALSALSTLAVTPQPATAGTVIIKTNSYSTGRSPEMVRPGNYTYGGVKSMGNNGYWRRPNIVPYRLSPTPEGSPHFSYPQTTSLSYSRTTAPRQPQKTMGLIYTNQGSLDHFSMYMDWGNIAIQQNQPQTALNWYQKARAIRPNDPTVIRAIQTLQTPVRK